MGGVCAAAWLVGKPAATAAPFLDRFETPVVKGEDSEEEVSEFEDHISKNSESDRDFEEDEIEHRPAPKNKTSLQDQTVNNQHQLANSQPQAQNKPVSMEQVRK